MSVRVGINGFGRMGRLGLRAGWGRETLSIVRVNEIATDAAGSAHLLKFDSVHGTWDMDCAAEGETMIVGGQRIACSRNSCQLDLPCGDLARRLGGSLTSIGARAKPGLPDASFIPIGHCYRRRRNRFTCGAKVAGARGSSPQIRPLAFMLTVSRRRPPDGHAA